ncbi:MAG: 1-deoxy-D-xylulose-5-phosphate reductoisomerase [Bacteroidetes bacterium]|nr:1-deoxy-D-xylulose-5-phosphate reductoisomerase [Bacteroidota bacterium]MBX7238590.1 1-deoxy-D-xylulose-5-phosphate reductoisomerase [Bacteroidia bacterium]MCC7513257.1 1-deoxy-D-xylulose-5-phosphate reductoisomerase [Bacteroidia bacterium]MCW5918590.1 1-deoxy-D-xylulose-5-phosphate reductoisomerase [Bacteroidota bacterium]HCI58487.1 1-deoxy-D-xylulose-5-phosphate reductoisomerase [Bacteroidota bacterium]
MKKRIAILGSTGSIGRQALEVIAAHADVFEVELLTANGNIELLEKQVRQFTPATAVVTDKEKYKIFKENIADIPVKVFAGIDSVEQAVQSDSIDIVLTAMVGYAGLLPTIAAIKSKKTIALANKETLVVAGKIITALADDNGVRIYPVDSEHSAIFQCLAGEFHNPIEKIYLTASGGPFRGKSKKELEQVTLAQALKHPNWSMGAKITVDSATMMNKGLEMIEAKWLFGLQPHQIHVVVHPQSIIHSVVQFTDGSMKAQMGLPDMKLPILYALSFPHRLKTDFKRFNFLDYPQLTFEKPDTEVFSALLLAEEAMKKDGNMPCILNAANEVAVAAFLKEKISFFQIPGIAEQLMSKITYIEKPSLEDLIATDKETRLQTELLLTKKN